MYAVEGERIINKSIVKFWFKYFNERDTSLENYPLSEFLIMNYEAMLQPSMIMNNKAKEILSNNLTYEYYLSTTYDLLSVNVFSFAYNDRN